MAELPLSVSSLLEVELCDELFVHDESPLLGVVKVLLQVVQLNGYMEEGMYDTLLHVSLAYR